SPRYREPDLKTRVTGLGINLNISPVLLYNSLHSIEAQACAFPNSFGREKRLEDVRLHLFGNSRAVIANLNHHTIAVAVGSDSKLAFSVHRINRVINNVG